MTITLLPLLCPWCTKALKGEEEIEGSYHVDDETVCDKCHDNWFHENSSECVICCESFLDDDLSDCFVLFEDDDAEPGIYKAIRFPFYTAGLIGTSWLHMNCISRIGFVPKDVEMDGYPCEFICNDCIKRRKSGKAWR